MRTLQKQLNTRLTSADIQTFTSSGTWTKPSGFPSTAMVLIQGWGAGASGGFNTNATTRAGGGGGGSYREVWKPLSELGATETVTIGAGGASQAVSNTAGVNGGNTTFGAHLTARGGTGGNVSAAGEADGGAGGGLFATAATGTRSNDVTWEEGWGALSTVDTPGYFGNTIGGGGGAAGTISGSAGGSSVYGGGGGGGVKHGGTNGAGGSSVYGGAGSAGAATGTSASGTQPGGGGGGNAGGTASGAGGDGKCVVTVFY